MTPRFTITALAACAALAILPSCDKSEPAPGQAEQIQRDGEGTAWRSLMSGLNSAPDDEARIKMLEKFIAENGSHPDLPEAKRRLEDLTSNPEAEAKKAIEALAQKAIGEAEPASFVALFAAESIRQSTSRLERTALDKAVSVPTQDGPKEATSSLFIHPLILRGQVRRMLQAHAADQVDERCNRKCTNEGVNAVFTKSLGGGLFADEGKLNPDVVGPFLEKAWIQPDDVVLGVTGRDLYTVFEPTISAYIAVHEAMKEADVKGALEQMAAADPKQVPAVYRTWVAESKLEAGKLPAKDVSAIAGWWLRRHADGTAEQFAAQIPKVTEAYVKP